MMTFQGEQHWTRLDIIRVEKKRRRKKMSLNVASMMRLNIVDQKKKMKMKHFHGNSNSILISIFLASLPNHFSSLFSSIFITNLFIFINCWPENLKSFLRLFTVNYREACKWKKMKKKKKIKKKKRTERISISTVVHLWPFQLNNMFLHFSTLNAFAIC